MFLVVPRKATKNLSQGSQSMYGGLKWRAPKYDTGMITRATPVAGSMLCPSIMFAAQPACCP